MRIQQQVVNPVDKSVDKKFITQTIISGTEKDDNLVGTPRSDKISGFGGNDVIDGREEADDIDGGAGIDTSSYANSTSAVNIDLTTGKGLGGYAEGDILKNTENVVGSSYNDVLVGNEVFAGARTGTEFRVNSYIFGDQVLPRVAPMIDGGFVVVWSSNSAQDGSGTGVYGQRFDVNGNKVGQEFQVNTRVADDQTRPSIATLSSGNFVIVWDSNNQDGSAFGVYGQKYDVNGNRIGSEFQINTHTPDHQTVSWVTPLNGGFVVVWQSGSQVSTTSSWDVYGQRYDANGNKIGQEFQVNSYSTGEQVSPTAVELTKGGFVITWQSDGQDGSTWGVYGQRFDSNGNKVGTEFQINTVTSGIQADTSVAALPDGGFVVVWNGDDNGSRNIFGQRYDSNGNRVGSTEFLVNTYTTGDQYHPSIAKLQDGFVVVWPSYGQDLPENWPHAINCGQSITGEIFIMHGAGTDGALYVQLYPNEHRYVRFGSNGNFIAREGNDGSSAGCGGKSIQQLYSEARAFNFLSSKTQDTTAITSIYSNWPDAINCGGGDIYNT